MAASSSRASGLTMPTFADRLRAFRNHLQTSPPFARIDDQGFLECLRVWHMLLSWQDRTKGRAQQLLEITAGDEDGSTTTMALSDEDRAWSAGVVKAARRRVEKAVELFILLKIHHIQLLLYTGHSTKDVIPVIDTYFPDRSADVKASLSDIVPTSKRDKGFHASLVGLVQAVDAFEASYKGTADDYVPALQAAEIKRGTLSLKPTDPNIIANATLTWINGLQKAHDRLGDIKRRLKPVSLVAQPEEVAETSARGEESTAPSVMRPVSFETQRLTSALETVPPSPLSSQSSSARPPSPPAPAPADHSTSTAPRIGSPSPRLRSPPAASSQTAADRVAFPSSPSTPLSPSPAPPAAPAVLSSIASVPQPAALTSVSPQPPSLFPPPTPTLPAASAPESPIATHSVAPPPPLPPTPIPIPIPNIDPSIISTHVYPETGCALPRLPPEKNRWKNRVGRPSPPNLVPRLSGLPTRSPWALALPSTLGKALGPAPAALIDGVAGLFQQQQPTLSRPLPEENRLRNAFRGPGRPPSLAIGTSAMGGTTDVVAVSACGVGVKRRADELETGEGGERENYAADSHQHEQSRKHARHSVDDTASIAQISGELKGSATTTMPAEVGGEAAAGEQQDSQSSLEYEPIAEGTQLYPIVGPGSRSGLL